MRQIWSQAAHSNVMPPVQADDDDERVADGVFAEGVLPVAPEALPTGHELRYERLLSGKDEQSVRVAFRPALRWGDVARRVLAVLAALAVVVAVLWLVRALRAASAVS